MNTFESVCLFAKGQTLKHVNTLQKYVVQRTPAECSVNGTPSYQLEQIGLSPMTRRSIGRAVVFHRSQVDVEMFWISVDK